MDLRYPGFGTILVAGERYDHDVVIEGGVVRPRNKKPSRAAKQGGHTPLTTAEDLPWDGPRLVIGTGASGRLPVLDDVVAEAEARHVELVLLPTSEACALLEPVPPEAVHAVLHVTC